MIENYDIDRGMEYIHSNLDSSFTIREKLVQTFPGTYGIYLSIHFGPFLNEKIDTKEKKEAYTKIVHFLDHLKIPKEMEEYLENILLLMEQENLEKINTTFLDSIDDIDSYIANNKKGIEKYITFRSSKEYNSTPSYKLQQLLLEFQQHSGYQEIFITNLKILSNSYRDYSNKLQEANKRFIEKFPHMKESRFE